MQNVEHVVQVGFDPYPSFGILRYGNGDLTFRNCFLHWGAPSALGIAADQSFAAKKESVAIPTCTRNRLSFRAIRSAGYRLPNNHCCAPSNPNGL